MSGWTQKHTTSHLSRFIRHNDECCCACRTTLVHGTGAVKEHGCAHHSRLAIQDALLSLVALTLKVKGNDTGNLDITTNQGR